MPIAMTKFRPLDEGISPLLAQPGPRVAGDILAADPTRFCLLIQILAGPSTGQVKSRSTFSCAHQAGWT